MSDPTFHATGLEKYELLAAEAGNDNPFDTYLIRPESGMGDSSKMPILIPSLESSRIVGCSCESDYKEVVWFNLPEGEPQQCDCGKITKGSKEEPHVVDALDEFRMVGCVCNEHDTNIKWMWLFENKPKRCRCGYWFKLKRHAGPDRYEMPN
ncbi:Cytochrome c oxidase subunit 5B_ mitochondrial [Caligus rogercresseyi]|uniref:Cytochrome c oxidase subunit 5B_ mitochondrial n=1 Tax=Caligus rogercresseyi TaxID=217165 RepID=A0A7T8GT54_CALRO|nr:Cytochrome c oxidase subunit 5B_ mitochondrial [Caligus rogercresseyi]